MEQVRQKYERCESKFMRSAFDTISEKAKMRTSIDESINVKLGEVSCGDLFTSTTCYDFVKTMYKLVERSSRVDVTFLVKYGKPFGDSHDSTLKDLGFEGFDDYEKHSCYVSEYKAGGFVDKKLIEGVSKQASEKNPRGFFSCEAFLQFSR